MREAAMSYGTIRVKAEILDDNPGTVENLSDVKIKYHHLGREQKEHMYAVFLNNGNKEIGDKLLGLGTNDSVQLDYKDLARTALLVKASAVILVHNHPSGNANPTDQDIKATRDANEVLETIGVRLLDHVIISRNDDYSMRYHSDGPFT